MGSADPAPGQVKAAADDSVWDLSGEPRDWFFKNYLDAADQPLPFAFLTGFERKKQLEIKVHLDRLADAAVILLLPECVRRCLDCRLSVE